MKNLASFAVDYQYQKALAAAEEFKGLMNKHAVDALDAVRSEGIAPNNERLCRTVHNYNWHMDRHYECLGQYTAYAKTAASLKELVEIIERGVQ